MLSLYDSPLWTLHWKNKGLKEFHFLKKQNLESKICYDIDLPLKTKQNKTTRTILPWTPGSLLLIPMRFRITGHTCVWTMRMVISGSHQGGDGHGTQGRQTWPSSCCCSRKASSQLPHGFVKCINKGEVCSQHCGSKEK